MKNFLLLSAAYLSGPRLKGNEKEDGERRRGVSGKGPRVAIVKATSGGAGQPASGVVSHTQRKSPLNAGGKV